MVSPDDKKETPREQDPFYKVTRMILLAGVGAASLAQDEINRFLDRLVERGEMAESDAKKLVREVVDRREKLELERREQEARAKKPEMVTRGDLEALTARVAKLTRQVEALRAQQPQGGGHGVD